MSDVELEYAWFFRAEFPQVARTVFLILHDRGRSEDITQEAFIQLLAHWKKVSRYERPDAWVRRVAIRIAVRTVKRERMRETLERSDVPPPVEEVPDLDVARAIAGLSPMQRAAVVLFYFEDRPIAEIVHILGIGEGSVKVHLHRARERLAGVLGEGVGEDAR